MVEKGKKLWDVFIYLIKVIKMISINRSKNFNKVDLDKYIGTGVTFDIKVPIGHRKHEVRLSAVVTSLCNDGGDKDFDYVEEFEIVGIFPIKKKMSNAMLNRIKDIIYTTNSLYDKVCDELIDEVEEEKSNSGF